MNTFSGQGLVGLLIYGLLVVLVIFGGWYAVYFLFTLPRRRLERAMIFLELVDAGIRRGKAPEETLRSVAGCEDRSVSVRFHMAAAWVEQGATWQEAIQRIPRLLPPAIAQMILLADRVGGWHRIVPVCRRHLDDVRSTLQARQSWLTPSLLLLAVPATYVSFIVVRLIMPKFRVIFADMGGINPPFFNWYAPHASQFGNLFLFLTLIPLIILFLHVAGPRILDWLGGLSLPLSDWLAWRIPWQRLRLQRDFVRLLGLLLDAGTPEPEAVRLAAGATANHYVKRQAEQVIKALSSGDSLTDAIGHMDGHREFRWRFQQAAGGGARFEGALAGWCEALEVRAAQMQLTVTHLSTVGMLMLNALFVGLMAFDVFYSLVKLTEVAA